MNKKIRRGATRGKFTSVITKASWFRKRKRERESRGGTGQQRIFRSRDGRPLEEEKGYRSPSDWKAQSARTRTEKKRLELGRRGRSQIRKSPQHRTTFQQQWQKTCQPLVLIFSLLFSTPPPLLPLKIPHNNIFVINRFGVWDSPSLPHLPCFLVLRKTGELKGMMLFLVLQKRTIADLKSTKPSHLFSSLPIFFCTIFWLPWGLWILTN